MSQEPRVLIVEDDLDSRVLAQRCVQRALPQATIRLVSSVREARALAASEREPYDLALFDVMLTDGTIADAWEYLEPLCNTARIHLVSSLNDSSLARVLGDTFRYETVFSKPINPQQLISGIAATGGRGRSVNINVPEAPRVLILEDDPDAREGLEMLVETALPNAQTVSIGSVAEAQQLTASQQLPFHLVLLDVMLQDGTISDAWVHLADLCRSSIKFMITALDEDSLSRIVRGIDYQHIVRKPINAGALVEVLQAGLGRTPSRLKPDPRVLIAEDDASCRKLAELSVLSAFPQANIYTIASVQEARRLGAETRRPFDLALLDVRLLDGNVTEAWGFLEHLCQEALIFMVSTLDESSIRNVFTTVEYHGAIRKPLNPRDFAHTLQSYLGAPG